MATIMSPQDHPQASGLSRKASATNPISSQSNSKQSWLQNHANELMSGVEFRRVNSNELINFIAIRHEEIMESSSSFRIAVVVNDDNTFLLPPKQTFEEMIQAKRRQQMQLYAASNATTSVSERADRNIRSAARRQSELDAARTNGRNDTQSLSSKSRSRSSRPSRSTPAKKTSSKTPASIKKSSSKTAKPKPTSQSNDLNTPSTSGLSKASSSATIILNNSDESHPSDSTNGKLITSLKELTRQNPSLPAIDKKQIQNLLRSAAPGASIVLPDGKVIKKSRRGGARAGAGRKRNRPTNDLSSSRESADTGDDSIETSHLDNDSTNHSLSSASQLVAT